MESHSSKTKAKIYIHTYLSLIMTDKVKYVSGGVSTPTLLTIVFLILKLTDTIDWKWLWVFSPLWIIASIGGGILVIVGIVVLCIWIFG